MPRRGRSLRTVRAVKPKFKWSPVYNNQQTSLPTSNPSDVGFSSQIICANTATAENIVPPVLKIRHLKVKLSIAPVQADLLQQTSHLLFYLVFCPQGIDPNDQTPALHPEWILAASATGTKSTETTCVSMTSAVSKNLNSGDTIKLLMITVNQVNAGFNVNIPVGYSFSYVARTN